ncbi:MAG: zinc-dependent metalloprotease [Acidimicrobiia bacterium]|nr:zinc-dependent metalloprotease [Acidimicrobiia bacterium]MBP8179860.1 zinc-dependent metalloprotease [Acidimicrobiia bacterium]
MSDDAQPGQPFDFGSFDLSSIMSFLQADGPVHWELAEQVGNMVISQSEATPDVPAGTAENLENFTRLAQLHIAELTHQQVETLGSAKANSRREWFDANLRGLASPLEHFGARLQQNDTLSMGDAETIPGLEGFALPTGILSSALLGLQAGFTVGHLSQYVLGQFDLPLPTKEQPELRFITPNIVKFGSDWSLPTDDFLFAVCLLEVSRAGVWRHQWLRALYAAQIDDFLDGYDLRSDRLESLFSGAMDMQNPESLLTVELDPLEVLGALSTPQQQQSQIRLRRLLTIIEAYAEVAVEQVGETLIPSLPMIREAMRRHRVERGQAERFIEGLLGLETDHDELVAACEWVRGVLERAGWEFLNRMWESERNLPTPNEMQAPGLWVARVELDLDD